MTRTTRRTIPTALAVLGIGAALVGCQQGADPGAEATPSPSVTEAETSSPSPTPSETETPEEEAIRLAEAAVHDYYEMSGEAAQDPEGFRVENFKDVAITTALTELRNRQSGLVALEQHAIGEQTVEEIKDPKVDLTDNPDDNEIPNVEFLVCYDVSELNIVDADGKSVVPPDREPRGVARVGVVNYEYPDADHWKVGFTEWQEGETC